MRRKTILLCLLVGITFQNVFPQLRLNEWVLKNSNGIEDSDGDHSDWVELYNGGIESLNLAGFGLSDSPAEPYRWVFPAITIQPGEFLLVFCSDKDRFQPELHTNFKLSDDDELVLTDPIGNTVQSVPLSEIPYDVSQGSIVDGSTDLKEFYQPTPGSTNLDGLLYNRIDLSHQPGFHPGPFQLSLSGSENHEIRYTLDGSEPTISDSLFSSAIDMTDRSLEPLNLSSIPTTAPNLGSHLLWETPEPQQFKGTVLRLRSFHNGQPTSHIVSASYFVHPLKNERYSLPVVSIISDSLSLFDYDTGIYVPGIHHDIDPDGGNVWGTGNYHQTGDEWERLAHVQLFSNSGEIELDQQIGLRIHGSGSTAMPQKSLRLYAREAYGEAKMDDEVFPELEKDEFDVVVLRNMGQDFITGVAQDVLANRLIHNMYQFKSADRPAICFINGEYWGIQNLRERFDKHYLSTFHELHEDSVDIIENYYGAASQGDGVAFSELYSFIESNDLSIESNFEVVASKMHIADFIDNTLMRIYLGCYDWPGNNVRMWRERSETGKFRWLLLDNDGCLGNASFNSLQHATEPNGPSWPNPPESTLFLRKLLENNGFKQQFISRMAHLLNTSFDRLTVGMRLTELYETYLPEYDEHHSRWKALDENTTLTDKYEEVMNVVRTRSCHVREHFLSFFNLQESEFPFDCDSSDLFLSNPTIRQKELELLVYPNPNTGSFYVKLPTYMNGNTSVELIDSRGASVLMNRSVGATSGFMQLNFEHLSAGIYLLRISDPQRSERVRVVIQ
ncbi:MAG: hypothetical protein RL266_2056 [Bacteroidota bacterium]|jgi:hypothetical protein